MSRLRVGIGLAVFLIAVGLGFAVAHRLAPQQLRTEIEERLSEVLGGQVEVGQLQLSVGLGLQLVGHGVTVWPGEDHAGLSVQRVTASIRPLSHLTGQMRLRRITLDGATMTVERSRAGRWTPPPAAELFDGSGGPEAGQPPHPDELLQPIIALESGVRFLMTKPLVADTVEVRNGRILLIDASPHEGGIGPHVLKIEGLQARLNRRRFLGDTHLRVKGRLRNASGEQGAFEMEGVHSRNDELRISAATTELGIEALAPHLQALHPEARLAGRLSGVVMFRAPAPGSGFLEVDLVGLDMRSLAPSTARPDLGPLEADRVELSGELEIHPQFVRLESARFASDALDLQIEGVVQRPLHGESQAQLSLALRDVTLAEVRHLIGWLPEIEREETQAIVGTLESGHLVALRTGGAATLSGWQAFLAGRTRELPKGFVLDAQLADTTVRVADAERIEELSGRMWWTGNRIEVRDARARLNGSPLPELDLTLDGVSNFFAVDPSARRLEAGAKPLLGLRAFWEALQSDDDEPDSAMDTTLALEIERLDHPMFLWPIANMRAVIDSIERGVRIRLSGGTWAGVPVDGEADWLFQPGEKVRARFAAGPPHDLTPQTASSDGWARGRFELDALQQGWWRHESARGRFTASDGEVRFHDARVTLETSGQIDAAVGLDFSRPDDVPFRLSFSLIGGDVSTLADQVGLPPELATGSVDVSGSFEGTLDPRRRLLDSVSGLLDARARDGSIRRAVPAVVAIALASEVFNPLSSRGQVRYDSVQTLLTFENGHMGTDAFTMEGPDIRAFASGEVDIAREPHPIDAEVVLFLFRQVDSVIDKIPLLNLLLLGTDQNLMAAYFNLEGPWEEPEANLVPLKSLASAPGSIVFTGIPKLVIRGLQAIDSLLSGGRMAEQESAEPPAKPPTES